MHCKEGAPSTPDLGRDGVKETGNETLRTEGLFFELMFPLTFHLPLLSVCSASCFSWPRWDLFKQISESLKNYEWLFMEKVKGVEQPG